MSYKNPKQQRAARAFAWRLRLSGGRFLSYKTNGRRWYVFYETADGRRLRWTRGRAPIPAPR